MSRFYGSLCTLQNYYFVVQKKPSGNQQFVVNDI